MATRVLSMSARLGPEEPVFAQLKPVLGGREGSIFAPPAPEELKPPPAPPQPPSGARMPGEEMVQVRRRPPVRDWRRRGRRLWDRVPRGMGKGRVAAPAAGLLGCGPGLGRARAGWGRRESERKGK
uniref:Uncharacterized protein n=1 Tax=Pseudonaja textilis TaxID=8673 RepID=A0A670XYK5_PSETE